MGQWYFPSDDVLKMPLSKIGAICFRSTNQSINDSTGTNIIFNSASPNRNDNGQEMWEGVTNPDRITLGDQDGDAGIYVVMFNSRWAPNATGIRVCYIRVNGTIKLRSTVPAATGVAEADTIVGIFSLEAGDYLEARVYQTSGAALNHYATESRFAVWKIGEP